MIPVPVIWVAAGPAAEHDHLPVGEAGLQHRCVLGQLVCLHFNPMRWLEVQEAGPPAGHTRFVSTRMTGTNTACRTSPTGHPGVKVNSDLKYNAAGLRHAGVLILVKSLHQTSGADSPCLAAGDSPSLESRTLEFNSSS